MSIPKFMWSADSTKINQEYKEKSHTGIDVQAKSGANLYAAEAGTVIIRTFTVFFLLCAKDGMWQIRFQTEAVQGGGCGKK